VATRSDWYAHVVFNRPSPIVCFHIVNLTDPLFHLMKHSQNMKVCSVCASRSTRCPFCFSSVNNLYASSTGIAAFMWDDPFVNPLCVGFCILWINGCIISLITASTILPFHCFKVGIGVQQWGILSTDLYKLYINPLLDRLQDVGIGLKIGNINVNNITELSTAMSSAHPVLLTLMFPIFSPIPTSCKRSNSGLTSRCKSCIRQSYTFTSVPAYVPRGNSGQNVDCY
jgi:hypothetical protein